MDRILAKCIAFALQLYSIFTIQFYTTNLLLKLIKKYNRTYNRVH